MTAPIKGIVKSTRDERLKIRYSPQKLKKDGALLMNMS